MTQTRDGSEDPAFWLTADATSQENPLQIHVGHVFDNIHLSGSARAIFGDVQISCPEIATHMSLVQTRRGR